MRSSLLAAGLLLALGAPAAAQSAGAGARDVVQTAERAVSDDSADVVRARWTESLRRDSSGRAAALGLGSLARLVYDFPTAERHFHRILTGSRASD